jgi:hypothetical protein
MTAVAILLAVASTGCRSRGTVSKAGPSDAASGDGESEMHQDAIEDRPTTDRAEFLRALARVEPGMLDTEVRRLLGPPGDIRTARDPGGIAATRTVEVWRYGTRGHLTFATLGTVHIQADRTVQYVFGGRGAPPPSGRFAESELRRLLRVLDEVPSYSEDPDPLPLIRAVNALVPLGKDRALAAIDEYLRVSSSFDDPGRDGVFLVVRTLFEVPADPGHLPVMMVGAPSPPAPVDPKALPRFPIAIIDDIPLRVVTGYSLAGHPESPESHLTWYRQHGVLRTRPLAPTLTPMTTLSTVAGTAGTPLLRTAGLDQDGGRRLLLAQGLRLLVTVFRGELAPGADLDTEWQRLRAEFAERALAWDAAAGHYTLADGSVLVTAPQ